MPDITLSLPSNSRFSSSLNEIDAAMKEIFLTEMRIADPRDTSHKQSSQGTSSTWLWNSERVFQVDDMTTEDIFETWLLRNSKNNQNVDVTYPLLGYKQNDIDTVFWGKGNRYHQWEIVTSPLNSDIEVGDTVYVKSVNYPKLFGTKGTVAQIANGNYTLYYYGTTNFIKQDKTILSFTTEELRQTGTKMPISYKAKAITCTYSAAILVDNRDEAQYIRDHFILRCNDGNIWFKYASPILNNTENQIYTVFGIPTLERYPSATDRLKGKGYIYGVGIDVNVWATVTETPLPQEVIEQIRMTIQLENEERSQRFIIN